MAQRSILILVPLLAACPKPVETPTWSPGVVYPARREANARGYLDRRGLIHAHSPYSHDACDGKPRDENGTIDPVCFDDFRGGLCQARHDFAMITDHRDSFTTTEFPEALLYRVDRGDQLLERNGPVANWLACPDAEPALVMAGCETDTMPVGLEGHVDPSVGERGRLYGDVTQEAIDRIHAAEGLVLLSHTERYSADDLTRLPFDGFEMFNVHANLFANIGPAYDLVQQVERQQEGLMHPDLFMLAIISEEANYVDTWGSVLARGFRKATTMGSDCHRNTLPQIASDGDRIDSYRRVMIGFTNHLLIRPKSDGSWDDRDLKEALQRNRLYGAFEYLGYPEDFDFYAQQGDALFEMGDEVSLASATQLVARRPKVQNLDPKVEPPELTVRILRAIEGGWEEAGASTDGDVTVTPTQPGAYRAEVRMVAKHLAPFLGRRQDLARTQKPWIYSNAVYVVP